jgi:hypothetical protein
MANAYIRAVSVFGWGGYVCQEGLVAVNIPRMKRDVE